MVSTVLYTEWRRLLRRWQTAVAFILLVVFILQGFYHYAVSGLWTFFPNAQSAYLAYLTALGAGYALVWPGIAPLVASLVIGDSLARDRQSGFINLMLARVSRRTYIMGKILATTLLTGAVVSVGFITSFVIAILNFPLELPPWKTVDGVATFINPAAPDDYVVMFPTFMHNFLFEHPLGYVCLITVIVVLSTVLWANLSLLFSLHTKNIYLVIGGPWLLYILSLFVLGNPLIGMVDYTPLVLSGSFTVSDVGLGPLAICTIWLTLIGLTMLTTYTTFCGRRDILE